MTRKCAVCLEDLVYNDWIQHNCPKCKDKAYRECEAAYETLDAVVQGLVMKAKAGGTPEGTALQNVVTALQRLHGNMSVHVPHW